MIIKATLPALTRGANKMAWKSKNCYLWCSDRWDFLQVLEP